MKHLIFAVLMILPAVFFAQDYAMYETLYLTPKPGHGEALRMELAEHNQKYHAKDPYSAYVFSILDGPRAGKMFWAMGPCTFSDLDDRPAGDHDKDWVNSILAHANMQHVENWVRDDALSYAPEDDEPRLLDRVRFFEVADNALFRKVQTQILKVVQAMGGDSPRIMYQRRFIHRDGRDWATVSSYKNWAELDEEGPDFRETFDRVHGAAAWEQFDKDFNAAIISREDEWRQSLPDLNGPQN